VCSCPENVNGGKEKDGLKKGKKNKKRKKKLK
jgi:hypothetical protein